jgi:hypothetical protein
LWFAQSHMRSQLALAPNLLLLNAEWSSPLREQLFPENPPTARIGETCTIYNQELPRLASSFSFIINLRKPSDLVSLAKFANACSLLFLSNPICCLGLYKTFLAIVILESQNAKITLSGSTFDSPI